ncbi:hypothetical protein LBMAG42_34610 [Deltaproteobacteria bacterium]|nr:hypothetical protein LBMAG42_34610 [Deltaproteobacteria bacterium]
MRSQRGALVNAAVPRALTALAGAGLGFCVWWAAAGSRPETGMGAFKLAARPLELTSAALLGTLRNDPAALELSALRGAQAAADLNAGDTLTLGVVVPQGASLLVRLGKSIGVAAPNAGSGGGPPPGGPPPPGRGRNGPGGPGGGAHREIVSPGIVFDRGANAELRGIGGLTCTPMSLPEAAMEAQLVVGAGGVEVAIGPQRASCTGAAFVGPWQLRSGVAAVRVERAALYSGSVNRLNYAGGPWYTRWPTALGLAAVGAALAAAGAKKPPVRRALLPFLLAPWIATLPLAGWLESIRVLSLPEAFVPVLAGGVPAVLLVGLHLCRERGLRPTLAIGLIPAGLFALMLPFFPDAKGWTLLALSFLPWMVLFWANTRGVRAVALWSWGSILAALMLAEAGTRFTALDKTWIRTAGYERAATEFKELLELQTYRRYPSEGFPVQPPDSRAGVRRIVALGGSSTGGAYQMDDINLFWPKKLEEALAASAQPPAWEVVNQGVGGWNTLHIRLYAESQLERLNPDILVLYVGHNDLFTRGVASHKALLDRYRQPANSTVLAASDVMHRSRLFVGFKFVLLSWRGDAAVAVPLADARENLNTILGLAQARGAHVLLVTEGLSPDAAPMSTYADLLAELAETSHQRAFDASARFAAEANPDDFLDDCHLTVSGHVRLARWIEAELRDAGWLAATRDAPR